MSFWKYWLKQWHKNLISCAISFPVSYAFLHSQQIPASVWSILFGVFIGSTGYDFYKWRQEVTSDKYRASHEPE